MLAILNYPDPGLSRQALPVQDPLDPQIQGLIRDMFETLYGTHHCAALAATQLDVPDAPAITVIDLSEKRNEPLCLINPVIVEASGHQKEPEGCMSVYPDHIVHVVPRAQRVVVTYLNQEGQEQRMEAEGYLAKCLQHEIDHLNGHVYLHRLSAFKKARLLSKINKVRRRLDKAPGE